MTAYVLHSVEDAIHYVDNHHAPDNEIFCTHSAVYSFLRYRHNILSTNLSDLFTMEEIVEVKKSSLDEIIETLNLLDEINREKISAIFGIDGLRVFYSIFSYFSYFHILGYTFFKSSIERVIEERGARIVYVYNKKLNEMYETSSDMASFIEAVLPNFADKISILEYVKQDALACVTQKKFSFKTTYTSMVKTLKFKMRFTFYNVLARLKNPKALTVLFYGQMYGLRTLLLTYGNFKKINIFNDVKDGVDNGVKPSFNLPKQGSEIQNLIAKECAWYVESNINALLSSVDYAKKTLKANAISLAIWGSPPVFPKKAIFFEYLRVKNIKIVGIQHGNSYVDQYAPDNFQSDFDRCDYFISYGFTDEDLKRLYPAYGKYPKILPFGRAKLAEGIDKKTVDILFPITNSITMFAGGMIRTPFGVLCEAQSKILGFLRGLDGMDIVVKPFAGSSENNSCAGPWNHDFGDMRYLNSISLSDFLNNFSPKIVIIEYPSSPLIATIDLDTEIFLLLDMALPYERVAFFELQKRVHCYESVDDLIDGVKAFLEGKLEPKRDDSYMNHYVYKPDTHKNVLEAIEKIIEGKI